MVRLFLFCIFLATSSAALAQTPPGKISGGRAHEMPAWFKSSFLNFQDEVEELRASGRHILVFMDLNDCPYCARTLEENFHQGANREYIQKNFDVIAVNVRGAGDVTWIDGANYSEQELALKLKVYATPTLVFIDPDGKKVLQLNGYRSPASLRHALEYVHAKAYRQQSLAAFTEKQKSTPVYKMREHARFEKINDLSRARGPLAVIFENPQCVDCASFHEKVLNHPEVLAELKPFRVARLDTSTETPLVDVSGTRTTPRAWAAALDLNHRPGVVLFQDGKEAARLEGRFYHFHFKELLRYVSGRHYQRYDRFGSYLVDRQAELLRQGVNIDLSE